MTKSRVKSSQITLESKSSLKSSKTATRVRVTDLSPHLWYRHGSFGFQSFRVEGGGLSPLAVVVQEIAASSSSSYVSALGFRYCPLSSDVIGLRTVGVCQLEDLVQEDAFLDGSCNCKEGW